VFPAPVENRPFTKGVGIADLIVNMRPLASQIGYEELRLGDIVEHNVSDLVLVLHVVPA